MRAGALGGCLPPAFAPRASAHRRQYRAFAGIAHGRHTHGFFDKLIRGGFATTYLAAPAHARRIYRVQYVGDGVETHVELVPVTPSYLRLERMVGTA